MIVISSRAEFAEACPYADPSDQVGECPCPAVVRGHRIRVVGAGQVVRTRGHRLSTLPGRAVVVAGRASGLGSRARWSSFEVGREMCWHGGFASWADQWRCWIVRRAPRRRGGPSLVPQAANAWLQRHAMGWPFLLRPWTTSLL